MYAARVITFQLRFNKYDQDTFCKHHQIYTWQPQCSLENQPPFPQTMNKLAHAELYPFVIT